MVSRKVWNYCTHDNTILRHFIAKIVFLSGSNSQEKKILERKTSFSNRETP